MNRDELRKNIIWLEARAKDLLTYWDTEEFYKMKSVITDIRIVLDFTVRQIKDDLYNNLRSKTDETSNEKF